MESPILNDHNKQEFPPAHTAEHLLNGLINKRFNCGRAFNAHIERKKSKLDYHLGTALNEQDIKSLEDEINRIIEENVEIWTEFVNKSKVADRFDLERLPDGASETVRIVHIGNYDECLCVGNHVKTTNEIGKFRITSHRWENGIQRIIFKVEE